MDFLRLQAEDYKPNFVEAEGEPRQINDLIGRHMRHKAVTRPADAMVALFFGNEVNAMAMLRHRPPFDFHMPGDAGPLDPEASIVPYGALRDMIGFRIQDRVKPFITEARARYDGPILIAPPPPPIPDENHILANPGGFREMAEKRGISPAPLRRKLWQLYCDVLREHAESAGAKLLPLPERAFDESGYFRKDFWHWDPTHGNFAYGELMIRHILSEVFSLTPERIAA